MAAENKPAAGAVGTGQAVETEVQGKPVGADVQKGPVDGGKAPARYMYVGPTVPGIGIQNRVYTGIPQEVKHIVDGGNPVIGDLFIQIRDYPKAERMIREQKGYLYNAYLAAQEIRMENVKKAEGTFSGGAETEERG